MGKKKELRAVIRKLNILRDELLRQRNMLLENKDEDQFEISQMRAGHLMTQKINEEILFGGYEYTRSGITELTVTEKDSDGKD